MGEEGQAMGTAEEGVTAGQEGVAGCEMTGELVNGREKQSRQQNE